MSQRISNAAVVCLSGGMDSTSLLLNLLAQGNTVFGLSFAYGQRHAIELEFLNRNLEYLAGAGYAIEHRLMDLSGLGSLFHSALLTSGEAVPLGHYAEESMKQTVVPNRNAIFASIAYGWALSLAERRRETVALGLGVHSGDHAIYPDCRPEFYHQLQTAFSVGNWESDRIEWYLPYLHCDKAAILRDAETSCHTMGLDFDTVLSNTLTSYLPDPSGRSHGLTGSDVERILAFHQIGRQDPIQYAMSWDDVLAKALELDTQHRSGGA